MLASALFAAGLHVHVVRNLPQPAWLPVCDEISCQPLVAVHNYGAWSIVAHYTLTNKVWALQPHSRSNGVLALRRPDYSNLFLSSSELATTVEPL